MFWLIGQEHCTACDTIALALIPLERVRGNQFECENCGELVDIAVWWPGAYFFAGNSERCACEFEEACLAMGLDAPRGVQ